jgi:CBS domain-containing protein
MDTIGDILNQKGRRVHATTPETSVVDAVALMCKHRVGSLLVRRAETPVGTFTERDLMARVILPRRDPAATTVGDVMTPDVACVTPDTSCTEAMAIMSERRCRHLPVVALGHIVGLVSMGDLARWSSRHQEFEIRMLRDYITLGR